MYHRIIQLHSISTKLIPSLNVVNLFVDFNPRIKNILFLDPPQAGLLKTVQNYFLWCLGSRKKGKNKGEHHIGWVLNTPYFKYGVQILILEWKYCYFWILQRLLYLHYLCTIFTLSFHYLCTIFTVSFHYLCTIFALSLLYLCTIFALSVHYLCTIFALSLHYFCTIFALSLHYLCTFFALSLHYLSTILALSWQYLGNILALS